MVNDGEFAQHQVWNTIGDLKAYLRAESQEGLVPEPAGQREDALAVVAYIESVLKRSDRRLLTRTMLGNLASHLTQALAQHQQLVAHSSPGYGEHRNVSLEHAVTEVGRFPAPFREDVESIAKVTKELLHDQSTAIQKQKVRIAEQDNALSGLTARLTELESAIAEQRTRGETALSNFQSQFSNETTARAESFAGVLSKAAIDNVEFKNKLAENLEAFENDHKARMDAFTKLHLERKEELDKIFSSIGSGATAHYYEKAASREFWQRVIMLGLMAIVFLVCGVVLAVMAWEVNDKWSWQHLLGRVSVVGVGLIGARAFLREASSHRQAELQARERSLKLSSLGSFIVSLGASEQHDIRKKLALEFFAVDTTGTKSGPEPADTDLTRAIVDLAKPITEAAGKRLGQ